MCVRYCHSDVKYACAHRLALRRDSRHQWGDRITRRWSSASATQRHRPSSSNVRRPSTAPTISTTQADSHQEIDRRVVTTSSITWTDIGPTNIATNRQLRISVETVGSLSEVGGEGQRRIGIVTRKSISPTRSLAMKVTGRGSCLSAAESQVLQRQQEFRQLPRRRGAGLGPQDVMRTDSV